jgi:hypothetical protein
MKRAPVDFVSGEFAIAWDRLTHSHTLGLRLPWRLTGARCRRSEAFRRSNAKGIGDRNLITTLVGEPGYIVRWKGFLGLTVHE